MLVPGYPLEVVRGDPLMVLPERFEISVEPIQGTFRRGLGGCHGQACVSMKLCKQCNGLGICEHNLKSGCKKCGGSGTCEHNRITSNCKQCGGSILGTLNV